jgi:hypothetical protein
VVTAGAAGLEVDAGVVVDAVIRGPPDVVATSPSAVNTTDTGSVGCRGSTMQSVPDTFAQPVHRVKAKP